ncbi:hypothetical protein SUGI_0420140 [Cryptomeria japonica]|nr:hypothetical protein SUGI_0420140 [Cryptomeria japonica]
MKTLGGLGHQHGVIIIGSKSNNPTIVWTLELEISLCAQRENQPHMCHNIALFRDEDIKASQASQSAFSTSFEPCVSPELAGIVNHSEKAIDSFLSVVHLFVSPFLQVRMGCEISERSFYAFAFALSEFFSNSASSEFAKVSASVISVLWVSTLVEFVNLSASSSLLSLEFVADS